MKKIFKVLGVLVAIAAAVCAVLVYLKNNGYITCCNCDCDDCDCADCENECESCDCKDCEKDDDFSKREYVSIQPKVEETSEELQEIEE